MRDIFLSKIETKIEDIRKLWNENLISQLRNSIMITSINYVHRAFFFK